MNIMIYIADWKAYVDCGMILELVITFREKFKSITGNETELVPNTSLCNQLKYLCLKLTCIGINQSITPWGISVCNASNGHQHLLHPLKSEAKTISTKITLEIRYLSLRALPWKK